MSQINSELILFDFSLPNAVNGWFSINDVVMGGVSTSRVDWHESGGLLFTGTVSLENNGGFASIRSPSITADLSRAHKIRLLARGDGKKYKLTIRTSENLDQISYQVHFLASDREIQEFIFPIAAFTATYHGRKISGEPHLDPAKINNFGFIIADRQQGPFHLEIQRISVLL